MHNRIDLNELLVIPTKGCHDVWRCDTMREDLPNCSEEASQTANEDGHFIEAFVNRQCHWIEDS